MIELVTEIEIAATPERVWSILLGFPKYGEWNPFIRSLAGNAAVGQRLTAFIQPPGGKGMAFKPTVLVANPQRELRWLGRLFVPSLFDGEHYFRIEPIESLGPNGERRVKFVQGEKFSGLLVSLMRSRIDNQFRAGFMAMNAALKALAEGAASAAGGASEGESRQ